MACKKRRLDVKDYRFDLPATEDSLLDKTLAQLRLNTLKMVPRTGGWEKRKSGREGGREGKMFNMCDMVLNSVNYTHVYVPYLLEYRLHRCISRTSKIRTLDKTFKSTGV